MSIATNNTNTTSNDPSRILTSPRSTPNVRSWGADAAPGFAQILHAFDSPTENSELTQATDNSAQDDERDSIAEQSQADDAQASSDQDGAEDGKSPSNQNDDAGSHDATRGDARAGTAGEISGQTVANENQPQPAQGVAESGQPQSGADSSESIPNTKQAVGLDLLVNRGDQAKLSMRGLVQALKAQASPDLTTIAVDTRLGQTPQNADQTQPRPQTPVSSNDVPEPDVAPPAPRGIGPAGHNPGDSLSDQPPQSGRGHGDPTIRQHHATPVEQSTIKPESDQARSDTQQIRSTRIDAAQPVQTIRTPTDVTRSGAIEASVQTAAQGRVQGALTARAISGIEAGVGHDGLQSLRADTPKTSQLSGSEPVSERASIMAQVQRGLASLLRSSNGDMTLKLTPSHLGSVQINIKRDGDRITLRMTASTAEARDLLNAGGKDLMQALQAKGVKVENLQIDLQQPDAPAQDGASAGFGGERDASHGQNNTGGRSPSQPRGDGVIPLETRDDGLEPVASGSIWSELGLDAIA